MPARTRYAAPQLNAGPLDAGPLDAGPLDLGQLDPPAFRRPSAVAVSVAVVLCVLCVLGALGSPAHSAWSSDAAVNLPVASGASDQILPKVAPTSDGGCWISWFDGIANGFDVRVQRLDAAGDELLPTGGVLVADRGFSSVQDYGLDVDASDAAILAFRDDGGVGVQVTAAKVLGNGTLAWGASGVQVTSTSDFVASPKVTGTSDGGVVVSWTQNADTRIQKLDPAGLPLWGAGVSFTPGTGSYSVADMHDSGTDAIVSFVHQTGGFGSPRHIYAQKLDSTGALLWGAGHVAVFDGGSLQFGNFPPFEPDGSGGAVFGWYDTSSGLQCRAQHILANGTEAFPHDGSVASTNGTRVRVSPSVSFDPGSGETFLFWEEQNSLQSQFGLYGQKFDAAGARLWSAEGAVLVPVGADELRMVRQFPATGGAFVFWSSAPGFGQNRLYGGRVDANGVFDIGPFDVSSTPSGKSRLDVARSSSGFAILAWSDERDDGGDILAQNVNADGTLGPPATGTPEGPGSPGIPDRALAGLRLGPPSPNPTRDLAAMELEIPRPGSATIHVFDVTGRRVNGWSTPQLTAGTHRITWDLREPSGLAVTPGVYFARVTFEGLTATRRIVRSR